LPPFGYGDVYTRNGGGCCCGVRTAAAGVSRGGEYATGGEVVVTEVAVAVVSRDRSISKAASPLVGTAAAREPVGAAMLPPPILVVVVLRSLSLRSVSRPISARYAV